MLLLILPTDGCRAPPTSTTTTSHPLAPTRHRSPLYYRALFLLYAIPHVIAAHPQANATDVVLVATRLCQALESTFSPSCRSAGNATDVPKRGAATWEAQLVLVNVLIHMIFLEVSGKSIRAKKRVVDAIIRWMEANSASVQKFCPAKLTERLTKVLSLKKKMV